MLGRSLREGAGPRAARGRVPGRASEARGAEGSGRGQRPELVIALAAGPSLPPGRPRVVRPQLRGRPGAARSRRGRGGSAPLPLTGRRGGSARVFAGAAWPRVRSALWPCLRRGLDGSAPPAPGAEWEAQAGRGLRAVPELRLPQDWVGIAAARASRTCAR